MIMKCRKCDVELVVGENWLESYAKKGSCICRKCQKEYKRKYYDDNKEKIKENTKEYYENNKEKIKEYEKEYQKEYYENNKDTINKRHKLYYEDNKEELKEQKKVYHAKPETKKRNNEREKMRKKADPNYRIARILRDRIRKAIKNGYKAGSAVRDLGISVEAFKMYLAEQFEEGMAWENHGTLWHVDHIKPLCEFDLTDREQFLEAANWMNQRPMWAVDNLKKISEDKKKSIRRKG